MNKLPQIIGEVWFNSKKLKPDDLEGKVVLIDFWTYSCVNCRRTIPYLKEWWRRYKDKNFVIIGVHTPEFEFEESPDNVEQAIKDLGVEWPVVLDNNKENWDNFANRYWPAKYLADKEGNIVYTHFGEGNYAETENEIRKLLGESAVKSSEESLEEHSHKSVCFIPTPETYCGYERGNISNEEGYVKNKGVVYKIPKKLREDSIALSGKFFAMREYVESRSPEAVLLLFFRGTEVNLVLHPVGRMAKILVELNGKLLPQDIKGIDVHDGGEVIIIDRPRMYNLIKSDHLVEGFLTIKPRQGDFQAYAFTFSGCME